MSAIKLLCIGDSITHGNGDENSYFTSYRYPLWKKFIDNGMEVEFVGPYDKNHNKNCIFTPYKGHEFSNKHFGTYGIKIEPVIDMINDGILTGINFDIVIINIGHNNRTEDYDVNIEKIPALHTKLINVLRKVNKNAEIFLAGLNDSWTPGLNEAIFKNISLLINANKNDESYKLHYMEPPVGWIANPELEGTFTLDWAHPNEKGCIAMADTYFDFLVKNSKLLNA